VTEQNEPPRIQQERRTIEVGEEASGIAIESPKGTRGKSPTLKQISESVGVSRATIIAWKKEGVDITNDGELQRRKSKPRKWGGGRPPLSREDRVAAWKYANQNGVTFQRARVILKRGYKPKRRQTRSNLKTSQPKFAKEYLWNVWIMAEYKRELKAFPDWRKLARRGLDAIKAKERYAAKPAEERSAMNAMRNAKKDKGKLRQWERQWRKQRLESDPQFRIKSSIRSRFGRFKKGRNLRSILKIVGCTMAELKTHLESKFVFGMTWENYGTKWHIDHIIPCKHFDHADPKQVEQCWHWTNMQPLWARENCQKQDKITDPQMSLRIDFAA